MAGGGGGEGGGVGSCSEMGTVGGAFPKNKWNAVSVYS